MSTQTDGESRRQRRSPAGVVLEVLRFEGQQRVRVTAVLAVVFTLFAGLFLWIAPDVVATDEYADLLETMPPALTALFGFENVSSVAGLIAGEYYTFTIVVGLAGYLAYSAAGTVAGDLRAGRLETLLAAPVSRSTVLLGKFLALLVQILVLNIVVPLVLFVGSHLADTPIPLADLAVVHVLAIPYLLCWSGVGLFAGVVVRRGRTAGRVAVGVLLGTWLVESAVVATDYEWVGAVSPMRYFEPSAVLVDGRVDFLGTALLLAVTLLFVGASLAWFQRRDL